MQLKISPGALWLGAARGDAVRPMFNESQPRRGSPGARRRSPRRDRERCTNSSRSVDYRQLRRQMAGGVKLVRQAAFPSIAIYRGRPTNDLSLHESIHRAGTSEGSWDRSLSISRRASYPSSTIAEPHRPRGRTKRSSGYPTSRAQRRQSGSRRAEDLRCVGCHSTRPGSPPRRWIASRRCHGLGAHRWCSQASAAWVGRRQGPALATLGILVFD